MIGCIIQSCTSRYIEKKYYKLCCTVKLNLNLMCDKSKKEKRKEKHRIPLIKHHYTRNTKKREITIKLRNKRV